MNFMQVSLKNHLSALALPESQNVPFITFPEYQDFQNYGKYVGECPLVFSFESLYQNPQGWMEVMDGYLFLVNLLYSTKSPRTKTILPRLSLKILPASLEGFHYSHFAYETKKTSLNATPYVFMDYFENLTDKSTLTKNLDMIRLLCSQNENVKLVLNPYLNAQGADKNLTSLFQGMRTLPSNCTILPLSEYSGILNMEGATMHYLCNEDVQTRSLWEELTINKNGVIRSEKISPADKLVHSFDIYPNVKKEIYFHKPLARALSEGQETELKKIVGPLTNPSDLLDKNYHRLIKDIIHYEGSHHEL